MEAKLVTYTTENLNYSEKSKLSKKMFGYKDKSNSSKYIYRREGILSSKLHVKICNNTFLIAKSDWPPVKNELLERKATIKEWDITIDRF